jgi:hypothetical protein
MDMRGVATGPEKSELDCPLSGQKDPAGQVPPLLHDPMTVMIGPDKEMIR